MEAIEEVCARCSGTGWRRVEREGLSAVERCDCVLTERTTKMVSAAAIPPQFRDCTFENFTTQTGNPAVLRTLQSAVTVAASFAREYPYGTKRRGLLFLGDPGTGKTHLAVAVMKRLISRGFHAAFFDYQNLLERIRAGYDPAAGAGRREAYEQALDVEILVLDDLGAHRVTDWVEDTVTSLITYRYNNNKPIIATTNLRDPEAGDAPLTGGIGGDVQGRYYLTERIGIRARSRLFEMCRPISTRGVDDFRVRKGRAMQ